jgi:aquaporin Z
MEENKYMAKTAISSKKSTHNKPADKTMASKAENESKGSFMTSFKASVCNPSFVRGVSIEALGTFLLILAFYLIPLSSGFVSANFMAFVAIAIILITSNKVQLNPALTIGAWVTRKIGSFRAVGNILAQAIGAVAAFFASKAIITSIMPTGSTINYVLNPGKIEGKEWTFLVIELVCTAILALAFAKAAKIKHEKAASALVIGFSFAFVYAITYAIGLTVLGNNAYFQMASFLNPALAFSVGAVNWSLWPILIYVFTPIVGGVLGYALQDLLAEKHGDDCDCKDCDCK